MRIGKSRLNLTAGIRLSKNIFFGDGISGALAGRGIFGTTSQALAISPQFAQGAATFGTTSAAQLPYLAQGANTFGLDHSATASSATFLLDEYPGAAAAYSIRLLNGSYSGPLVRIRKDTGGQPEKDFYPDFNNELSLNSGDGGGTTLGSWIGSNDGYIVTWYSQTGSNDAAQTSAASQAQIITAGALNQVNSKASVSFSASYYQISTTVTSTTATIFAVHKNDPSGMYKTIFGNGLNNGWALTTQSSKYNLFYRSVADQPTTTNAPNNIQALVSALTISNSSQITRSQGVEIQNITPAVMVSPTTSARIGAYDNNNNLFTGDIQEIVVYDTDKSSNFTGIETNINDYFNIYP